MTIDEATRHAIHEAFITQMGPDLAGALMELLPPVGWADVATRHDIGALKQDIGALKHDIGALREDMVDLEARLNQRFDERLDDKLAATEAGLRTEIADRLRSMTVWMASVYAVSLGTVAAVARLG